MKETLLEKLIPILLRHRLLAEGELELLSVAPLAADGSTRRFVRVAKNTAPLCLAVMPASTAAREMAEAAAAWQIGRHLQSRGVPVPELLAREEDSGLILFEDLGDTRLHDLVIATDFSDYQARANLLAVYREIIGQLVVMQVEGAVGLDEQWCWDTPRYDRQLMLERESGYFLRAFWSDLLGMDVPVGVEGEFAAIAGHAAEASCDFFLHRDFQCRNIMIKEGRVRFIDYQGGRRGPLGYDLASLLIDPYAALPEDCSSRLFEHYLDVLGNRLKVDVEAFRRHYALLALQRNLQIIGAFAFLSQVRGKTFFAGYIRPAVHQFHAHLQGPLFADMIHLRAMADKAMAMLDNNPDIRSFGKEIATGGQAEEKS
jgi:aminoglycoside/choline kinase family phosphotransferase